MAGERYLILSHSSISARYQYEFRQDKWEDFNYELQAEYVLNKLAERGYVIRFVYLDRKGIPIYLMEKSGAGTD